MVAAYGVQGGSSRARIGLGLAALIAAIATLAIILLPLGPDVSQAERSLQGPPTFGYPGVHGPARARCVHTGLFGLFGSTDACILTFQSGGSYHCRVFDAGDELGLGMGCASRPFPALTREEGLAERVRWRCRRGRRAFSERDRAPRTS